MAVELFPVLTGGANDSPVSRSESGTGSRRSMRPGTPTRAPSTWTRASRRTAVASSRPRSGRPSCGMAGAWALAVAERQARLGYFGLGNDTEFDHDRRRRTTPFSTACAASLSRRGGGDAPASRPAAACLPGQLDHAHFTSLPGPSNFVEDFGEGSTRMTSRDVSPWSTTPGTTSTTLIKGLLLEAGAQVGELGRRLHAGSYSILRGYLPIREGTVRGGAAGGLGHGRHAAARRQVHCARLGARGRRARRTVLPPWVRHRPAHRKGTLFGNLEVRHDVLPFGDLGAISLVAFLDAGRVFEARISG